MVISEYAKEVVRGTLSVSAGFSGQLVQAIPSVMVGKYLQAVHCSFASTTLGENALVSFLTAQVASSEGGLYFGDLFRNPFIVLPYGRIVSAGNVTVDILLDRSILGDIEIDIILTAFYSDNPKLVIPTF